MVLKLLKLFIGVACLAAFTWWAFTVPLGKRTLYEHAVAIGRSKESKDLVEGTKGKVTDLRKKIVSDNDKAAGKTPGPEKARPKAKPELTARGEKAARERISSADREEMRRLLDSARSKVDKNHTAVR